MRPLDRRDFLGLSLGGMAGFHSTAWGAAPAKPATVAPVAKPKIDPKPAAPVDVKLADPLDTLFLSWRRDPTTSIVVQWVGPRHSGPLPKVELAPVGHAGNWTSVEVKTKSYHPTSELRVHRAEAVGLKPGTEYQFRVGSKGKTQRFRTMPAKATDTFQFVSGGDCGVNEHAAANNILAARQNPMFALIGGDIAYDNGHDVKTNLGFLMNYRRHMVDGEGRLIPMVVCIGNHEVKGGYDAQRADGPLFFNLHDAMYEERSYATLDFGDYLSLVLLDTGHVAKIEGEQTAWLDRTLAERAEVPNLIVANHVPAYPSYRAPDSSSGKTGTGHGNRVHWAPLFEKHNVDLVLEHHDHTFKRTHLLKNGHIDAGGILYLGDGSWGKLRAPKAAEARPYLAAVDEAYHLTVHRLEGERRFHLALAEGGGVVDVCLTQKKPRRRMGRGA